jgi:hypothetical protein
VASDVAQPCDTLIPQEASRCRDGQRGFQRPAPQPPGPPQLGRVKKQPLAPAH